MLHRIRLEIAGKKPKSVYRRLYSVQALDKSGRKCKSHQAWVRYSNRDIVVYLIDGGWVSYGKVKS